MAATMALALCGGCGRLPESFAPPRQHAALVTVPAGSPGYFFSMADADADAYLAGGFAGNGTGTSGPGAWRWAYEHPVLRFWVPEIAGLQFQMEYTLPESTFKDTGPVTLAIAVNGKALDRTRVETAGQHVYAHAVPAEMLHANAINFVAIDPSPVWISRADGGRLGFILSRAGFTE